LAADAEQWLADNTPQIHNCRGTNADNEYVHQLIHNLSFACFDLTTVLA
jgi:hypothetical protein